VHRIALEGKLGHDDLVQRATAEWGQRLRAEGWHDLLVTLLRAESQRLAVHGTVREALAVAEEALRLAEQHAPNAVADMLRTVGATLIQQGEHQRARALFQRGVVLALASGRSPVWAQLWVSYTLRLQGRLDEAQAIVDATREEAVEHWMHRRQWFCEAGELARASGDLEEAERCYLTMQGETRLHGGSDQFLNALNLLLVQTMRGELAAMATTADELVRETSATVGGWIEGSARLALAASAAGSGDWASFDANLGRGDQLLADAGVFHADNTTFAEAAARCARDAGDDKRARAADRVAARQRGDRNAEQGGI
jgi:tetratricopeptide (TPR) repeat protein